MSSLVERVAAAIFLWEHEPGCFPPLWREVPDALKERLSDQARAAIAMVVEECVEVADAEARRFSRMELWSGSLVAQATAVGLADALRALSPASPPAREE